MNVKTIVKVAVAVIVAGALYDLVLGGLIGSLTKPKAEV